MFVESFPRRQQQISIVPNCVYFDDYQGLHVEPVPNQLVFSGSFRFRANYEAMQWFVENVYPKILERIPETCLMITGDHADLPLPPSPNIMLAGYVEDIKGSIASSCVSLAPLLSGGGTRLKILEAMALGTAVVATTKGAEGLDATAGGQLFVADDPQTFADHVVKLLKDKKLRDQMTRKASELVKEKYNWDVVMPRFLHLAENAVSSNRLPG